MKNSDLVQDIRCINDEAVRARCTGVIVLGGGMVKHHAMNANLMRNGCEYCVYVSTAQEFDGSDSGARPDEAKSWGKIRVDATPVKVYADATLVFPLLVAQTFANLGCGAAREACSSKPDACSRAEFIFDKSFTPNENAREREKLAETRGGEVPAALQL